MRQDPYLGQAGHFLHRMWSVYYRRQRDRDARGDRCFVQQRLKEGVDGNTN